MMQCARTGPEQEQEPGDGQRDYYYSRGLRWNPGADVVAFGG